MDEPLRHRQTKGAATDMLGLKPPRHIPTLPIAALRGGYQALDFDPQVLGVPARRRAVGVACKRARSPKRFSAIQLSSCSPAPPSRRPLRRSWTAEIAVA